MLSVSQLNAQIKITEIWKAVYQENYPNSVLIDLKSPSTLSRCYYQIFNFGEIK